jgi:hypothetical protein
MIKTGKEYPAIVFAEDMTDEMSKDAVKIARDAYLLAGDVNSSIADLIRKKFDRDYERGWNCIVGKSFGAFVTHEIKSYIYFSVQPGSYVMLWK